jgi:hypothetical protein
MLAGRRLGLAWRDGQPAADGGRRRPSKSVTAALDVTVSLRCSARVRVAAVDRRQQSIEVLGQYVSDSARELASVLGRTRLGHLRNVPLQRLVKLRDELGNASRDLTIVNADAFVVT